MFLEAIMTVCWPMEIPIRNYNGGTNYQDVFIACFDSNGTNQWLRNGASVNAWGFGLTMDTDSTFYIIGDFTDTLTLGTHQIISQVFLFISFTLYKKMEIVWVFYHFQAALGIASHLT